MEPGWSLGDGRHPWDVSVKMTFTEGSRSFCYHRECVSWDYYLQATEISFGNLGHNRSCKDCKGMGGSQNGLEGDSQAARLEKDECEVSHPRAWKAATTQRSQLLSPQPPPLPAANTHPGINPLLPISVLPPRDPGESSQGSQPGGTAAAHHGWESTALSWRVPERWAVPGLLKE